MLGKSEGGFVGKDCGATVENNVSGDKEGTFDGEIEGEMEG